MSNTTGTIAISRDNTELKIWVDIAGWGQTNSTKLSDELIVSSGWIESHEKCLVENYEGLICIDSQPDQGPCNVR
jgi:hypothetical protein